MSRYISAQERRQRTIIVVLSASLAATVLMLGHLAMTPAIVSACSAPVRSMAASDVPPLFLEGL